MSTPDSRNLLLGAGAVFFSRFAADGSFTNKWRHLGNVDKVDLTPTADTKDKTSSMTGLRALLASTVVGFNLEVSLELTEFDAENLALALLGDTADLTQTDTARDGAALNGGSAITFGVWYPLLRSDSDEDAAINPYVLSVSDGLTTTSLEGTDYEVNRAAGLIRILESGSLTEAITHWRGSVPGYDSSDGLKKVSMLTNGKILGRVRYIAADDLLQGPKENYVFYKCQLTPDGAIGLISDDYAAFTLKCKILQDTSRAAGDQYGRMDERPDDESGS